MGDEILGRDLGEIPRLRAMVFRKLTTGNTRKFLNIC
jgi:hypothetical protein